MSQANQSRDHLPGDVVARGISSRPTFYILLHLLGAAAASQKTRATTRATATTSPSSKFYILTKLLQRRVVLTVLSSFLRQSCLVFTNVTSALEVF